MESHGVNDNQNDEISPSPQPSNGTSFCRTCFNGVNALSGVGILSVPYALSEGGWLCLIILLLVAVVCCYTGFLLQRCMSVSPSIKTYPDIGEHAFGNKGRVIVSSFMYLELYLVAVEFLILEGDNLQKLFPGVDFRVGGMKILGREAFVILVALIILPTTWLKSLGLLAYVSAGGVLASVILVGAVFWVGAGDDGVGFEQKGTLWRWSGLPTTVSLFTFCYCGHAVFPTLRDSMKDRTQFPKVLFLCFILSTFTYGSMATMGYLMYGQNLMSQVTLNLPTSKISSKIAIYTTLINPITKYALVISPIAMAIEDTFPFRKCTYISYLIRTVLVTSTVIVALAVPFFGYVMTFIGAFLGVSVSIVLPSLCYLKIKKPARSFANIEFVVIGVILVLGTCVAVSGTYVSLKNILTHVQQKN